MTSYMYVQPENRIHSEEIQKKLFAQGYTWGSPTAKDARKAQNTSEKYLAIPTDKGQKRIFHAGIPNYRGELHDVEEIYRHAGCPTKHFDDGLFQI